MLVPADLKDASEVLQALAAEVSSSFPDELQLVAVWVESQTTVCVVYKRVIDPEWIFGRRLTFPPHARPDDPASTGLDAAEFLREPPGASMESARTDGAGITWLGLGEDPLPRTPFG